MTHLFYMPETQVVIDMCSYTVELQTTICDTIVKQAYNITERLGDVLVDFDEALYKAYKANQTHKACLTQRKNPKDNKYLGWL